MESGNYLKNLLQTQLATDASAVRYLPYCLSTLSAETLASSSHLVKWTTRISSLLHSKEPGARWAGLCLAYKSSLVSQSLMVDCAQAWIGAALPMLSRNEPLPTTKAAIRLLRLIFSNAMDIPEFQRQVSLQYVVKFTLALVPLADNHSEIELKVLCMETLSRLIPFYASTHRASATTLNDFALRYLSGSACSPTNNQIALAASKLYAILPVTAGKVGSVTLWRKSLDETLSFAWNAYLCLRTTSPIESHITRPPLANEEPQVTIPLNQDRLKISVAIISELLNTAVQRPVQVPIGNLIKFITALLSSSTDRQMDGYVDPLVRSLEVSAVPSIVSAGAELVVQLGQTFPYRLDTHSSKLMTLLAHQLEQKQQLYERLLVLKALQSLLENCHQTESSVLPTRLAKAVLPTITKMLTSKSKTQEGPSTSKSKTGKKRARNYEGDEVFNVSREVAYPTTEDGEVLLASIDVLHLVFKNHNLSSSMRSIVGRVVICLLVALPRTPSSVLSDDPSFFDRFNAKTQSFSVLIGTGTTSVMSKALPFIVEAGVHSTYQHIQDDIAMLLHPRQPPLIRSMPHVESLSLFKAQESLEETEALAALGIDDIHSHEEQAVHEDDVTMADSIVSITPAIVVNRPQVQEIQVQEVVAATPPVLAESKTSGEPILQQATAKIANSFAVATPPPAQPGEPVFSMQSKSKTTMTPVPSTSYHQVILPQPEDDEDEDQEMPSINMESDSEEDEEG